MIPEFRKRLIGLLRQSEPYVKTDMVYLASSGFWLTASQVVSMAGAFALSLAFGNFVSKDVFGNYKFVFSLVGLFGTFSLTAIGSAITQAVARGYDGTLRQGFRIDLVWSIPSALLMFSASLYYFMNANTVLGVSLLIAALAAPFMSAFNMYITFLQGKKDFRRMALYGFAIDSALPLVLIALMLSEAQEYVPAYVAGYYAVMTALAAIFYFRTSAIYKPSGAVDPAMTANALHLSFIAALGRISSYLDKILVFHFLGAAPLAVYSFAAAPSQYVLRFNGVFKTLGLPKLALRDIPTLKQTLPRKIALHFVVALCATALYIVLIPYFFQIFFPQYVESIPYAQVLGLTILSAPGVWLGQTLLAHMRKRELYIQNTIMPILRIVLFVVLIPTFGLWGLVAATLLSGLIGLLLSAWIFSRL